MSGNKMQTEKQVSQRADMMKESSLTMGGPEVVIAESHFDSDIEGWTLEGDGTLTFSSTGGNPGGCLKVVDGVHHDTYYYCAPEKFLGHKLGATRLEYDLKWVSSNPIYDSVAELTLARGGTLLRYDASLPPRNIWSHHNVSLSATDGWTNVTENRPATARDFEFVLRSLEALKIRGEFASGSETGFLDNVVMYFVKRPPILP